MNASMIYCIACLYSSGRGHDKLIFEDLAGYPLMLDMVEHQLLDNRVNSCPEVHKDWVDHVVEEISARERSVPGS